MATHSVFTCRSLFLIALLAVCATLLPFHDAMATVTTIGKQAQHVAKEVVVVPRFIAVMCYVIGVFFAARGLLALKNFINEPKDNPITQPLGYLLISALLIALPHIIEVSKQSLNIHTDKVTSTSSSFSDTGG